jgi:murein DD-endopeptidase MepM/ murein hydrolase activator NlpD
MLASTVRLPLKRAPSLLLSIVALALTALPAAQAQSPAPAAKPFILPFKDPPGPGTWLLGQPYGNTTGAYRQRNSTYVRSGGIHFGVDLSAPCGTEVLALADGVVFAVDNLNFGSAPHNLMVDYPAAKYASLYGHLLKASTLNVGQKVKQGEVFGLSGDSEGSSCQGRPHLHLEIRDLGHARKYNPATLIQADWDNLALIGSFGTGFEYNLDNPRQWQHVEDQPEAISGGPILNDFKNPWPPDSGGR